MSDGSFPRSVLLLAGLLVVRCTCGSAQDETAQPPSAPKAAVARLVLSPSVFGGSPLYRSWPLVLDVTLWRESPEEGETAPPALTLKAKQGAWCEALLVTLKDAGGAAVKWPLHLVKQDAAELSLGSDDSATAEWWLAPEETQTLAEGDYTVTVAFDPQKVDGLPTDAAAPRSDVWPVRVAKEPAPLTAQLTTEKLFRQAWFCLARGDLGNAAAMIDKLMAADPASIHGRQVKAMLLARQGKPLEALFQIDEAMDLYGRKYPHACPPDALLALHKQLLKLIPEPATKSVEKPQQ